MACSERSLETASFTSSRPLPLPPSVDSTPLFVTGLDKGLGGGRGLFNVERLLGEPGGGGAILILVFRLPPSVLSVPPLVTTPSGMRQ